ncbi:hypothetical protein GW17_00012956 [Ensete ventricosum]|nr:hypothetical protein GW17_00012956 [Ensete ventricosum]RZR76746.1 hypothetical protein BHM03_00001627 [Ensete ventricosum]
MAILWERFRRLLSNTAFLPLSESKTSLSSVGTNPVPVPTPSPADSRLRYQKYSMQFCSIMLGSVWQGGGSPTPPAKPRPSLPPSLPPSSEVLQVRANLKDTKLFSSH